MYVNVCAQREREKEKSIKRGRLSYANVLIGEMYFRYSTYELVDMYAYFSVSHHELKKLEWNNVCYEAMVKLLFYSLAASV